MPLETTIDEARAFLTEKGFTQAWTTDEVQVEFEVLSFAWGMPKVRRKSDNAIGWMSICDQDGQGRRFPRLYYDFRPNGE